MTKALFQRTLKARQVKRARRRLKRLTRAAAHWTYDLRANAHRDHALRTLRSIESRLPTTELRFAVPFVFKGRGHFASMEPFQIPREVLGLYETIVAARPRRVVELGTALGGTLYLWTQAAGDSAVIVSVDLPGGRFGGGYPACRIPFYQAFARERQTLHLIRGNSRDLETVRQVAALHSGEPIDLLYIDADHTEEGVRADFRLYSPLVRPGGLIVFHDILPNPRNPEVRVHRLWQELKHAGEAREWAFPDPSGGREGIGIGLLRVPVSGVPLAAARA
jgi:cephalosporin hydroxylase